jgi:hypothetical protein
MIFRLSSLSVMLLCIFLMLQGCNKNFDTTPSNAYRQSVPQNVQLLDYTSKTLTIAWDLIPQATSYVVQLLESPTNEMPLYSYIAKNEDYYVFSNLEPRKSYYGRVRANFPNSATSDWVYVNYQNGIAKLIPLYGKVAGSFEIPYLKVIDSTSSTITAEWSFTGFEKTDTETSDSYTLELYNDDQGKDLYISWENLTGLFAPSTAATPKPLRFTFSGLSPDRKYYLKVKNNTLRLESGLKKIGTLSSLPIANASPKQSNDIVLSQDFSKFIHGGDIFHKALGYTVTTATGRGTWQPATGVNPVNSDLGRALCDLNTEFNVFDGGNVSAAYTKGVGMENWGKQGNTSTRPGYLKIGGNNASGAIYTPLLNLTAKTNVVIKFKAGVYSEAQKTFCDKILVQAIDKATFDAKGNITNANAVTIVQSASVDIAAANENFKEYTVTFNNVSADTRIVFSSDPADVSANKTRFLLDDIIIAIK